MDYETILASVRKNKSLVVLEEAWPFASVASRLPILFKNVLLIFLMHLFNVSQRRHSAPYSPVLLKEWLPNR
jgi:pyruvate dehydrogenase E1 component beta subunit